MDSPLSQVIDHSEVQTKISELSVVLELVPNTWWCLQPFLGILQAKQIKDKPRIFGNERTELGRRTVHCPGYVGEDWLAWLDAIYSFHTEELPGQIFLVSGRCIPVQEGEDDQLGGDVPEVPVA